MTLYNMIGFFKDWKFITLVDINNRNVEEETGGLFCKLRQYEVYEDSYRAYLYDSNGSEVEFDPDYSEDLIIVIRPNNTYFVISTYDFCQVFGYDTTDLIFTSTEEIEDEELDKDENIGSNQKYQFLVETSKPISRFVGYLFLGPLDFGQNQDQTKNKIVLDKIKACIPEGEQ